VPVPMITRVRLKNTGSIAEGDVERARLTILVRPNASGKSNFLDALHVLATHERTRSWCDSDGEAAMPRVLLRAGFLLGSPTGPPPPPEKKKKKKHLASEIDHRPVGRASGKLHLDSAPVQAPRLRSVRGVALGTPRSRRYSASRGMRRREQGVSCRPITVNAPGPRFVPPDSYLCRDEPCCEEHDGCF